MFEILHVRIAALEHNTMRDESTFFCLIEWVTEMIILGLFTVCVITRKSTGTIGGPSVHRRVTSLILSTTC